MQLTKYTMAELLVQKDEYRKRLYFDSTRFRTFQEQEEAKKSSKTIYIGNLSFYTREEQLYALMSKG